MSEQPLFDMVPRDVLHLSDKVVVQTIWGDEHGEVLDLMEDNSLVEVALERGDIITIATNRVILDA